MSVSVAVVAVDRERRWEEARRGAGAVHCFFLFRALSAAFRREEACVVALVAVAEVCRRGAVLVDLRLLGARNVESSSSSDGAMASSGLVSEAMSKTEAAAWRLRVDF